MARRFWPGEDPVGKRFKYGLDPSANMPWTTVVGVVADMRRQRLDEAPIPYMFQAGRRSRRWTSLSARAAIPTRSGARFAREMEALDPAAPPYGIITVEERLSQSVALRRFQTLMLAALAAVALVLALVGAYSIIHRSVASRTQEIGIRSALGASAWTISTMVLASGLSLGVVGLGIGLVGSVALSRAVASFLYETSPFDPLTYLAVTILLFVVTTAATLTPARRAARIDPMAALRDR